MMKIDLIKELRERTGAGVLDCKRALEEANGDMEGAAAILRKRGLSVAVKRSQKQANEGVVESYIHFDKRTGVLVELNCETDFVARTGEFRDLARDIAMQIAAGAPEYVSRDDIPEEVLEKEKEVYRAQAEGKPEEVIERIIGGKMEKFYCRVCLLDQVFIKDENKHISDLLAENMAKLGERIVVRRFVRFVVGEGG